MSVDGMKTPYCVHCEEPVEEGQEHPDFQQPMHLACGFRSGAGSLAHLQRRCSCYVTGATEGDPPGMTRRQAAQAALDYFRWLQAPRRGAQIQ